MVTLSNTNAICIQMLALDAGVTSNIEDITGEEILTIALRLFDWAMAIDRYPTFLNGSAAFSSAIAGNDDTFNITDISGEWSGYVDSDGNTLTFNTAIGRLGKAIRSLKKLVDLAGIGPSHHIRYVLAFRLLSGYTGNSKSQYANDLYTPTSSLSELVAIASTETQDEFAGSTEFTAYNAAFKGFVDPIDDAKLLHDTLRNYRIYTILQNANYPSLQANYPVPGDAANTLVGYLKKAGITSSLEVTAVSAEAFEEGYSIYFNNDASLCDDFYYSAVQIRSLVMKAYYGIHSQSSSDGRNTKYNNHNTSNYEGLPSYSDLFGQGNYLEVDHNESILSPAAYLTDLINLADQHIPSLHNRSEWLGPATHVKFIRQFDNDHSVKYEKIIKTFNNPITSIGMGNANMDIVVDFGVRFKDGTKTNGYNQNSGFTLADGETFKKVEVWWLLNESVYKSCISAIRVTKNTGRAKLWEGKYDKRATGGAEPDQTFEIPDGWVLKGVKIKKYAYLNQFHLLCAPSVDASLRTRRPDIDDTPLTAAATTNEVPTIELVNNALTKLITDTLQGNADLSQSIYPPAFNKSQQQMGKALELLGSNLPEAKEVTQAPDTISPVPGWTHWNIPVYEYDNVLRAPAGDFDALKARLGLGSLSALSELTVSDFMQKADVNRVELQAAIDAGTTDAEQASILPYVYINNHSSLTSTSYLVLTDDAFAMNDSSAVDYVTIDRLYRLIRLSKLTGISLVGMQWLLSVTQFEQIPTAKSTVDILGGNDNDFCAWVAAVQQLATEQSISITEAAARLGYIKPYGQDFGRNESMWDYLFGGVIAVNDVTIWTAASDVQKHKVCEVCNISMDELDEIADMLALTGSETLIAVIPVIYRIARTAQQHNIAIEDFVTLAGLDLISSGMAGLLSVAAAPVDCRAGAKVLQNFMDTIAANDISIEDVLVMAGKTGDDIPALAESIPSAVEAANIATDYQNNITTNGEDAEKYEVLSQLLMKHFNWSTEQGIYQGEGNNGRMITIVELFGNVVSGVEPLEIFSADAGVGTNAQVAYLQAFDRFSKAVVGWKLSAQTVEYLLTAKDSNSALYLLDQESVAADFKIMPYQIMNGIAPLDALVKRYQHNEATLLAALQPADSSFVANLTEATSWKATFVEEVLGVDNWNEDASNISDPVTTVTALQALVDYSLNKRFSVTLLLEMFETLANPANDLADLVAACRAAVYAKNLGKSTESIDNALLVGPEEAQRNALVAQVLYLCNTSTDVVLNSIGDTNALSEYLLTDVEVTSKVRTSKVKFAISAVQTYINRVYNVLEPYLRINNPNFEDIWVVFKHYRVWELNRKIFLFPENYLNPEFLPDASEEFQSFISRLNSGKINETLVQEAYQTYVHQVAAFNKMDHVDSCLHSDEYGTKIFILGNSRADQKTYLRTLHFTGSFSEGFSLSQATPWQSVDIPVQGDAKIAYAYGKVFVFYLETTTGPTTGDNTQNGRDLGYAISIKYTHRNLDGKFSPAKTLGSVDGRNYNNSNKTGYSFEVTNEDRRSYFIPVNTDTTGGASLTFRYPKTPKEYQQMLVNSSGFKFEVQSQDKHYIRVVFEFADALKISPSTVENEWHLDEHLEAVNNSGHDPFDDSIERLLDDTYTQGSFTKGDFVAGAGVALNVGDDIVQGYYPGGVTHGPTALFNGNRNTYHVVYGFWFKLDSLGTTLQTLAQMQDGQQFNSYLGCNKHGYLVIGKNEQGWRESTKLKIVPGQWYYVVRQSNFVYGQADSSYDYYKELVGRVVLYSYQDGKAELEDCHYQKEALSRAIKRDSTNKFSLKVLPDNTKDGSVINVMFNCSHGSFNDKDLLVPLNGVYDASIPIAYTLDNHASPDALLSHASSPFVLVSNKPEDLSRSDTRGRELYLRFKNQMGKHQCISIATAEFSDIETQFLKHSSVDELLSPETQMSTHPNFVRDFAPPESDFPKAYWPSQTHIDLAGTNGIYFRELFMWSALLVAQKYQQAGNHAAAQRWYQKVFDPTLSLKKLEADSPNYAALLGDPDVNDVHWQYLGLRSLYCHGLPELLFGDPVGHEIDILGNALGNQNTAIAAYYENPFDPDAIAALRPVAYQKYIVRNYAQNLIAWGDTKYQELTRESLAEAYQFYYEAFDLLGLSLEPAGVFEMPDDLTLGSVTADSDTLYHGGTLPDFLAGLEVQLDPEAMPVADINEAYSLVYNKIPGLHFGIIFNPLLRQLQATLVGHFSNLRANQDINGNALHLPLFQPEIDLDRFIRANVQGQLAAALTSRGSTAIPSHSFYVQWELAQEFIQQVARLGDLLLGVARENDAEKLANLTIGQQTKVLGYMREIKREQLELVQKGLDIAKKQVQSTLLAKAFVEGLRKSYAGAWELLGGALSISSGAPLNMIGGSMLIFDALHKTSATASKQVADYSDLDGSKKDCPLSKKAKVKQAFASFTLENASLVANALAAGLQAASAIAHEAASPLAAIPTIFGLANGGFVPQDVANSLGTALGSTAFASQFIGSSLREVGTHLMRDQEWEHQSEQLDIQLEELCVHYEAASRQVRLAKMDQQLNETYITQHQEIADFYQKKYSNEKLYHWMQGQLTTLYKQAYQLAADQALKAQTAFEHEKGLPAGSLRIVNTGAWNSFYHGQLAAELLLDSLHLMKQRYLVEDKRRIEVTEVFSLKERLAADGSYDADTQTFHEYLVAQSGSITFGFGTESGDYAEGEDTTHDFDKYYPGHYCRQIKLVTVSVPSLLSPYKMLHGTLTLNRSTLYTDKQGTNDAVTPSCTEIALSTAMGESGVHSGAGGGGYMPFENAGVDSSWTLNIKDDLSEIHISDIIITMHYTARND
ncbi:neuraminidase-like domain-containing protein [uncultured Microscilla sp.]|uniref:Tc toxin subunit A-related protein n=1 Tax=uncultured Microscilla sp. TaxID=432653 RepID=UPI00261ACFEC|nr:neuraminidase-like domain-containing protein [uncultured Microscilla sp.]